MEGVHSETIRPKMAGSSRDWGVFGCRLPGWGGSCVHPCAFRLMQVRSLCGGQGGWHGAKDAHHHEQPQPHLAGDAPQAASSDQCLEKEENKFNNLRWKLRRYELQTDDS